MISALFELEKSEIEIGESQVTESKVLEVEIVLLEVCRGENSPRRWSRICSIAEASCSDGFDDMKWNIFVWNWMKQNLKM